MELLAVSIHYPEAATHELRDSNTLIVELETDLRKV